MGNEHRVEYKVYYEDTDSLGVAYYANYLKFLKRGRSEFPGSRGRPIHEWNRTGTQRSPPSASTGLPMRMV